MAFFRTISASTKVTLVAYDADLGWMGFKDGKKTPLAAELLGWLPLERVKK